MKIMNGGQLLIETLWGQGVRHIFSISGGQMVSAYDAMANKPGMELITPRSETSAPLMAGGYTATSGIPSLSMATVGAGVVYEVAGLALSWMDYIPTISIAPQVQSWKMNPHQENLQGCDQDGIFEPITKWNAIVYHGKRIPQLVNRAFREAVTGVPGPVHLDIPVDVFMGRNLLTRSKLRRLMTLIETTRYTGLVAGVSAELSAAAEVLFRSERPLVLLGQQMGRPFRYPKIAKALGKLGIPIATTRMCTGVLPKDTVASCPGSLETLQGHKQGVALIDEADCLLTIGLDPCSLKVLERVSKKDKNPVIIQVESDRRVFVNTDWSALCVHSDPVLALDYFSSCRLAQNNRDTPLAKWKDLCRKILELVKTAAIDNLGKTAEKLGEHFKNTDESIIFIVDGQHARKFVPLLEARARYQTLYTMDEKILSGAGLPFAMGASVANPKRKVVLVCDRESLFPNIRELSPAVCNGLDLTIVCVDKGLTTVNPANITAVVSALGAQIIKDLTILQHDPQPGVRALVLN